MYFDIDVECQQPLSKWLALYRDSMHAFVTESTRPVQNISLILGFEWIVDPLTPDWREWFAREYQVTQWAMAAAPKHPALRNVSLCDCSRSG